MLKSYHIYLILSLLLQCVILAEARLSLQKRVNEFCHSQQPPIRVSLQFRAGNPHQQVFQWFVFVLQRTLNVL